VKSKQVVLPIPVELMAPDLWSVTWSADDGMEYTETFDGAGPDVIERTKQAATIFCPNAEVTTTGNTLRAVVKDPLEGLRFMLGELITHAEVRDLLGPGAFEEMAAALRRRPLRLLPDSIDPPLR